MKNRGKILLLEIIIGSLIGLFIISKITQQKLDFENMALGEETKAYYAEYENYPLHITKLEEEELSQLKQGWEKREGKDVMLILGNSQTHSINQLQEGDMTYNEKLFLDYKDSLDVLTISFPNANLQEFYYTFNYILLEYPVKTLVLPVFMDDLREDGIREVYLKDIAKEKYFLKDTSTLSLSINEEVRAFQKEEEKDANPDNAALRETMQAKSESYLDNALSERWSLWKNRKKVRGQIFSSMYNLRNTAFGINAQTKRKMIPKSYKENMQALTHMLELAENNSVKVLLYVPPIRQDVEVPYNLKEYARFKAEIEDIAKSYDSTVFANLEAIVPGKYWGVKKSTNASSEAELDFMHFQYEGHNRLYQSLKEKLKPVLE
jgi:hypothetical protein